MRKLIVTMLVIATAAPALAQRGPTARRDSTVDTYHGEQVPDPYRWLERLDAAEVRVWVRGQDSVTRAWLAGPDRARLRDRIMSLTQARAQSPPVRRGEYYFNTRFGTTGGAPELTLLTRRGRTGAAREIRLTDDAATRPVRRLVAARRTPLALFAVAEGGGSWQTWGVVDIARGRLLGDTLRDMHLAGGVAWADDDRAFYYARFRKPPGDSAATARLHTLGLYRHRLGTAQNADTRVYVPPSPDCLVTPYATGHRGLTIVQQSCSGTTNSLLAIPADGAPITVAPASSATYRFAGASGDASFWQTDADAPNHRVVRLHFQGREPRWTTIVREDSLPLYSWSGSPLGANLIGRTLVLAYQKDAVPLIRAYDLQGRLLRTIAMPQLGSIWSGFVGSDASDEAFYSVSGLASPGTIYRLDVATGRSSVWARPEIDLPTDSIVTSQVFVRSKDGTRFPMFVVRRRDTPLDGTAPAWIYGYGFGDWTASPWFQPYVAEFVNRGGVWALPNLRGGGEYGEAWNQAGSRERKRNTVDDYIAAAEYLIAQRYTSARRIVANASSAGGIVAAAAVLERPELYGAAILDFPVLDMLRYHLFTVAGTWTAEYGTVDDPDEYRVLRALSAPHNVRPGVCYPPILVTPGDRDETTPPFHAYKFVAALQHDQGCNTHPALLRVSWGAGHSFGKTRDDIVDNWTDQLRFLDLVLKPTRRISVWRSPWAGASCRSPA